MSPPSEDTANRDAEGTIATDSTSQNNNNNSSSSSSSSSSTNNGMVRKKKTLRSRRLSNSNKPQLPPERPRKSLIRKRPVSFGNPALGTYHGCIYTLDVLGEDLLVTTIPPVIIESAESVERIVAMVDVPPEQVPEGVLNLARSYRPYLHHVRIVIAESDNEEYPIESLFATTGNNNNKGQEETKDEIVGGEPSSNHYSTSTTTTSSGIGTSFDMIQNAALMLSSDEDTQGVNHTATTSTTNTATTNNNNPKSISSNNFKQEDDNQSVPARTYVVLLELCSKEAAEGFVEDLNGKPYTSLDETQICSVHQVLALSGEDGVSLLSPFFAPSTQSASSPKTASNTTTSTTTTASMTAAAAAAAPAVTATHTEDYNCAVCLEHMDLTETEFVERSSVLTTVCNHTFHLDCLLKWQDSPCPVCRYDHSGLNETLSQCQICGTTEHNFVCLICGAVSCGGPPVRNVASGRTGTLGSASASVSSTACGPVGVATPNRGHDDSASTIPPMETSRRLSQSHAKTHYDESLHAYALDTETQHVWDFAGQGYVHRLLQNKEDGKLVEVHNPANTSSHERSLSPGLSDAQEGEVLHRKLEGFASQYYTLLKSQLEQQRSYYQGRLEELRRESLIKKKSQTSDLIHALKLEKTQLSKQLASLKAKQTKVLEDVAFLKNMNESLEANREPLKQKVKEAQRQQAEAREQIQECLPVMEEKVTSLMLQLTGGESEPDEATSIKSEVAAAAAAPSTDSNTEEDVKCAPDPDLTKKSSSDTDNNCTNVDDDSKMPAQP